MADGAACFRQDSSGPALLRILLRAVCLPVRAFHPLRTAFPDRSRSQASTISESYNPGRALTPPVWALPRSLATTCGIIVIFSSCGYLDVSVPRVCPLLRRVSTSLWTGCPIRKSPDQRLFAPPRSLSQLITSFNFLEFLTRVFLFFANLAPLRTRARVSSFFLPVCQ